MKGVDLVLCIHSHQPVGNFDSVFEQVYNEAYKPFLDLVERHPGIKISAHYSGSLLEWLAEYRADFLLRLRALSDAGRIEMLGGGMYEPVFSLLSGEDALGQIRMMNEFLQTHFGRPPSGMWIPERVWEPQMASWFSEAGIDYSVLDDLHFRSAGVSPSELNRAFLTEDRGKLFRLFPGREELRYAIPFRDPEWTIDFLRSFPDGSTVVYADDGEKFGHWPETHKHCYEDGWLDRFFGALSSAPGIRIRTFSEVLEEKPPQDRIYLPTASYREMGGWSLPSSSQKEFDSLQKDLEASGRWEGSKPFFSGGLWRNFRVKYPELFQMYARMVGISQRVKATTPERQRAAQRDLYKAQCNCGWWHGVFGGVYLPHLRANIYSHLLSAEEQVRGEALLGWNRGDFDLDGREDLEIYNREYRLWLVPEKGARLAECDLRRARLNLVGGVSRRYETSHEVGEVSPESEEGVKSIHDHTSGVDEIEPESFEYDRYTHASLLDHFFPSDIKIEDVLSGERESGDFVEGRYDVACQNDHNRVEASFHRLGRVGNQEVDLEKKVTLDPGVSLFTTEYTIRNRSKSPLNQIFAVEFFFPVGEEGSFLHHGRGASIGSPTERGEWKTNQPLWLRDPAQGVDVGIEGTGPTGYWVLPLSTVALSEKGLQRTYQGTIVMAYWRLCIAPGKEWVGDLQHEFRLLL